jgi:hypothetical protein
MRLIGDDCGRLEFDLARLVEQRGNEDHAHCRIMLAYVPAPDGAEGAARGKVGRLVDAEGSDAADVLRVCTENLIRID